MHHFEPQAADAGARLEGLHCPEAGERGGSAATFTASIDELRAVDGWLAGGVLTWESGPNAGRSIEAKNWTQATGALTSADATRCAPPADGLDIKASTRSPSPTTTPLAIRARMPIATTKPTPSRMPRRYTVCGARRASWRSAHARNRR